MAQTSAAPAIKAAIIEALAAAPALAGVAVAYSWSDKLGREVVYGGQVSVRQDRSGGRDADGNSTRDQFVTIQIHVRVDARSQSVEVAEARAVEIGAALEAYLAVSIPDVTGLLAVDITGYELVSAFDDEGAFALATYPVEAHTYLS